MSASIRVLIVDDRPIVRGALQALVEAQRPRMECVGAAEDGPAGVALARRVAPGVVVLQYDPSRLDVIGEIAATTHAKVMVLADRETADLHDQAVLAGARGLVGIRSDPGTIVRAIERIHEGELWLDRLSTGRLLVKLALGGSGRTQNPEEAKLAALTERERRIVIAMCRNAGSGAKAVAESLAISESTLRNHLTSVYEKLGVANRMELFEFAIRNRLVGQVAA